MLVIKMSELTDDELVEHCIKGSNKAYERLVERHKRMAFNFAYRVLGNPEDAEDALQEAFLRAYIALPRFRRKSKFSTWLYSIVSNVCITHKTRRDKNAQRLETQNLNTGETSDFENTRAIDSPERTILEQELSERLQKIIARLPARYSAIITLRYFNDFTYEEIAEALDLTLANVKTRLFRAKEMLKDLAIRDGIPLESIQSAGNRKTPRSVCAFEEQRKG
jgi:RNA polymerase sigma-70 factor (ECF subfamily)